MILTSENSLFETSSYTNHYVFNRLPYKILMILIICIFSNHTDQSSSVTCNSDLSKTSLQSEIWTCIRKRLTGQNPSGVSAFRFFQKSLPDILKFVCILKERDISAACLVDVSLTRSFPRGMHAEYRNS